LLSAKLDTNIAVAGTLSSAGAMTATGEFKANGGAVFNEDSLDVDFRIESNNNANMLIVDGGNDRVGVGLSSPDTAFHVQSTSQLPQAKVSYDSTRSVSFGHSSIIQTSGASQDNSFSIHSRGFNSGGGNVIKFFTGGQSDGTGETEKLRILSGGGITFNGDTAAANALDDYEEGTLTPTLSCTGGNTGIVYTTQVGRYVKIGNMVHVNLYIELSSKGSASGNVRISGAGFPFTPINTAGFVQVGQVSLNGTVNGQQFDGSNDVWGQLSPGDATLRIYADSDGNVVQLDTGDISGTSFRVNISYFV